jgi:epoxide hydrolase-like predicted phosphatase
MKRYPRTRVESVKIHMKNTTVIFDLGNVILFCDHHIFCRKVGRRHHIDEELVYQKIFSEGLEHEFDKGEISPEVFTARCSSALKVKLDVDHFKEMWSEIFAQNRPVIDLIKALRKRGRSRLLLLSNTNVWHVEHVKKRYDVLALFDILILSCQVGCCKPDSRIYQQAMALSADPTRIIYVDDIPEYVKAACKLGIFGIPYTGAPELKGVLRARGLL